MKTIRAPDTRLGFRQGSIAIVDVVFKPDADFTSSKTRDTQTLRLPRTERASRPIDRQG